MHIGELNPLLAAAGMVVVAAVALLVAVLVAGWVWNRRAGVEPAVLPAPAEVPEPAPGERHLARAAQPELALRRESQRLAEYAAAAAQRAAHARAEAAAARERSVAAEAMRDVAWSEYETVSLPLVVPDGRDPVHEGGTGAGAGAASAAGGTISIATDGPSPADGQGVAHAAFMAFRRGAISVRELQRVWRGAADPDTEHQDHEREVARRLARRRAVRQTYESASSAAKVALEQARVTEVAADALAREAVDAERDARAAQASVERYLRLPE